MNSQVWARSLNGQVLQWRLHRVRFAEAAGALAYEPSDGSGSGDGPLVAGVTPSGFYWRSQSSRVWAKCLYGREERQVYQLPLSGDLQWRALEACNYVDLFSMTASKDIEAVVRLRRPAYVSGSEIEFGVGAASDELMIRPMTQAARQFNVVLLKRNSDNNWWPVDKGPLGGGRSFKLPQDAQGAFAVERLNHQLVALQPFAFRQRAPLTDSVREQIAHLYPMPGGNAPQDEWPLWLQTNFLQPLAEHADKSLAHRPIAEQLRVAVRRGLLADFLPGVQNWRPDVDIEVFVQEQWPSVAGLLHAETGATMEAAAFTEAFAYRDSPDLQDALQWASDDSSRLLTCLRLLPFRKLHRVLAPLVPDDSESRQALNALATELSGARPEATLVEERFQAFARLLKTEFGIEASLGGTTTFTEDQFTWMASLRELEAVLLSPSEYQLGSAEFFRAILDLCLTYGQSDVPHLVDRAVAEQLLARPAVDAASASIRGRLNRAFNVLMTSSVATQAARESEPLRLLVFALKGQADAISRAVAYEHAGLAIRGWASDTLTRLGASGSDLGDVSIQLPLNEWFRACLAAAERLRHEHAVRVEREAAEQAAEAIREARRDRLRMYLPAAVDPECSDALEHIALRIAQLGEDIAILRADESRLTEAETQTLRSLADAIVGIGDRRDQVTTDRRLDLLDTAATTVTTIIDRLVHELRREAGTHNLDVAGLLTRGGYAFAVAAVRIARDGRKLLWSQRQPLGELLWISNDSYLGQEAPRVARDVVELNAFTTMDDLGDVQARLAVLRAAITQTGLAQLHDALMRERDERWRVFTGDLAMGDRRLDIDLLPAYLLAAGAYCYGPDGPAIKIGPQATVLPQNLDARLRHAGLWPQLDGKRS
jgi:hypothetical protein